MFWSWLLVEVRSKYDKWYHFSYFLFTKYRQLFHIKERNDYKTFHFKIFKNIYIIRWQSYKAASQTSSKKRKSLSKAVALNLIL